MVQKYKLLVGTGKDQIAQTIDIEQGAGGQAKPVTVKAQAGMRYQLAQANSPQAPHNVRAKRVGKDLAVFLEDSQQANLVIQNYYDEIPSGVNALVGQAENGTVYSYVPENANAAGLIPNLADGGNVVGMALGSYEEFMLAAAPLVAAGTGGLGLGALAAGLGLAALAGGGGGGGAAAATAATDTSAPTGQTGALAAASDSGSAGDNLTNIKTPTITGKAEAGAKVEVTLNGKTYTSSAVSAGIRWGSSVANRTSRRASTVDWRASSAHWRLPMSRRPSPMPLSIRNCAVCEYMSTTPEKFSLRLSMKALTSRRACRWSRRWNRRAARPV